MYSQVLFYDTRHLTNKLSTSLHLALRGSQLLDFTSVRKLLPAKDRNHTVDNSSSELEITTVGWVLKIAIKRHIQSEGQLFR
jgi:hypothetical protein